MRITSITYQPSSGIRFTDTIITAVPGDASCWWLNEELNPYDKDGKPFQCDAFPNFNFFDIILASFITNLAALPFQVCSSLVALMLIAM